MITERLKQFTVRELEAFLALIKDKDTKVNVGVGDGSYPLCFLINDNGSLLLHTNVYGGDQYHNLQEVLSLNIEKNRGMGE